MLVACSETVVVPYSKWYSVVLPSGLMVPFRVAVVRVGRLVHNSVSAGKMSFAVGLTPGARKALKRHHRLALTVKITLTPLHGTPLNLTRVVIEHG